MSDLYRCTFDPLPDITAYELAMCVSVVGPSHIVAARDFDRLGPTLRHYRIWHHGTHGFYSARLDDVVRALSTETNNE